MDRTAIRLDRLPSTIRAGIGVLCTCGVIRHSNRAYHHGVWTTSVVCGTARPSNGTRSVGRVAAAPCPEFDHHRRLRVLPGLRGLWSQCSHGFSINLPGDLVGGPVNRVLMERSLIVRIGMEGSSIVCGSLTLPKIVALHLLSVSSKPFPIDFVKIVRLQHRTADYSDTRRWLHHKVDMSEHYVPFGHQLRRVSRFCYGEFGATRIVRWVSLGGERIRGSLCEVDVDCFTECWIWWATPWFGQQLSPSQQGACRIYHSLEDCM